MASTPAPHSATLRRGRFSEHGRVYLLTMATEGRLPVFRDFGLARAAICELGRCDALGLTETLAYVLMPDHLHWLLTLCQGDLSGAARRFKSNSARVVNRAHGVPGGCLWQSGFHDHAQPREEELRDVARYVVANPLRARLVAKLGDYPHWDAVWF